MGESGFLMISITLPVTRAARIVPSLMRTPGSLKGIRCRQTTVRITPSRTTVQSTTVLTCGKGFPTFLAIEKYAERYEDNTDALHAQTSDISSGKEEVSDHPLREVDKISKDRREDDLSQVDRVEFFAEKDDLHKDVKTKYDRHAGSRLHFYNVTDDIRKRIDRGDTQVGIGRKRHSQCHKEQRYTIEQYSDPPLGKCAFSHVVLHVRIIDRERAPQRALPLKDEE